MLRGTLDWLYRRLGVLYLRVLIGLQLQFAHLVVLLGVLFLTLFVDAPRTDIVRIAVVSQVLVVIDNALAYRFLNGCIARADPWLRGNRTPETAAAAWRAVAGLPLDFVTHRRALPIFFNLVPISVYATLELDQPFLPTFFFVLAGAAVVLLYGVLVRYFAFEIITRPVLEDVSREVEQTSRLGRATVPLKARLLVALPSIQIIGGVAVAGFSSHDHSLRALGAGVFVAIIVAFTVSLELTLLLARSILMPLGQVRRGTERVASGDYSTRVPVYGTDEVGELAASFNEMAAGLEERERLREAFGAFVDPSLAERVIERGTELGGEEVEVTVMFLDIRNFTAFAERAQAREVVGHLNDFYSLIVPVLQDHGGHANKFVGDGLLAVFGAPQRLASHADCAVEAALAIAACIEERYGGWLRVGIGINTGAVVAGTIGGGGRVEFTVIGDAVNTASRVEAVTRATGDVVLVTEATRARLERDHGGFVERPTVELKGKRERVRLYAPRVVAAADAPSADGADGTAEGVISSR